MKRFAILTLCGMWLCGFGAAADSPVPVPKSTPLPMTESADRGPAAYPLLVFLRESRNLVPVDLAKAGYTEDVFLISGKANVYDWAADGSLSVKKADAPYNSRI